MAARALARTHTEMTRAHPPHGKPGHGAIQSDRQSPNPVSRGVGPMSTIPDDGSITRCVGPLRAGDPDAARRLWEAYFRRVVGLARARLRAASRGDADEEDVALSVFDSFFRRAGRGQFPRIGGRDDLWQVLFVLTARKAANHNKRGRRLKRGGGAVSPLS